MSNRSAICGAAASVTTKVVLSFSQCKPHLLQQIIFGKLIGSRLRASRAPAMTAPLVP
ncbi:hypothetical protein FOZG_17837 [Fusarium oxysporum Fo47]|uniref:Uncharacterized protein n=1 Tax=Fusarium oxysporum Fo47 TaxID=660027 RepID=W9JDA5_FUSOX|nr:hypothetical protein FOZG_17837 [Fusarium oxysporum Fo47]